MLRGFAGSRRITQVVGTARTFREKRRTARWGDASQIQRI